MARGSDAPSAWAEQLLCGFSPAVHKHVARPAGVSNVPVKYNSVCTLQGTDFVSRIYLAILPGIG